MDENARSPTPRDAREVTREAMVQSALLSAERAEEIGLARDRILLSAKVSAVQDLISVYDDHAWRSYYALHLRRIQPRRVLKGVLVHASQHPTVLLQRIVETIRLSV